MGEVNRHLWIAMQWTMVRRVEVPIATTDCLRPPLERSRHGHLPYIVLRGPYLLSMVGMVALPQLQPHTMREPGFPRMKRAG